MRDKKDTNIQMQYLYLVDEIEKFNDYPWGRVAYEYLVESTLTRRDIIDDHVGGGKKLAYQAFGFLLALQVWAYEVIPDLGRLCAFKLEGREQVFPRILHWRARNNFTYDELMQFFPAEPLEPRGLSPPTEDEWKHLQILSLQQRHLSPPKALHEVVGKASPLKYKAPAMDTGGQKKKRKLNKTPPRRTRRNAVEPPLDSTAESKSHQGKASDLAGLGNEDIRTNVPLDEILAANVKELLVRFGTIEKLLRSCTCLRSVGDEFGAKKGEGDHNRDENRPLHNQGDAVRMDRSVDSGRPSLTKASCAGQVKTVGTAARQLFKRNPSLYDPMDNSYMALDSKPFQTWYDKAKELGIKCETPLLIKSRSRVNWDWFTPFVDREGLLCSEQTDALTNLLLFKHNRAPKKFERGWTLLEQLGTGLLLNGDINDVSSTLLDYVVGRLPRERGLPWAQARKVIGIANMNGNHWICYKISLDEAKIVVYDSTSKSSDWGRMSQQFVNMSRLLPLVCRLGRVWEGLQRKEPVKDIWTVEQFYHPPQQGNGWDCGVMAIKFMECLVSDFNVNQLTPDRCGIFRRSYCTELFELGNKHPAS